MRLLAFIFCLTFTMSAFADSKTKEPTFDRVMRTSTIRCGYMSSGLPHFMKDPISGTYSGIWYDYVEELGKQLGLKIEWTAELGFGDVATALKDGKVDALCGGLWVSPERAKVEDFVTPIAYQVVNAYARADDKRFDNHLERINDPAIKVSCIDGEMAVSIAKEDFPRATTACLPQSAPVSDLFMNTALRKADITFAPPALIASFNKTNSPGLRRIETAYPIRIFPESIAVAQDEEKFRRMLDRATEFLINSGKTDRIIRKYSASQDDFLRPAKPYEAFRKGD